MRWRGSELGVDSPMPSRPVGQRHWSPKAGDRLTAWRTVPEGGAFDGNVTPACGHLWFMHSRNAKGNGYPFVEDPHGNLFVGTGDHRTRVRKMTRKELRRDADAWGHAGVKRWRDKHGQAPMTHDEGIAWCVEHRRLAVQEAKFPLWAQAEWPFDRLHANCARHGHPAWVKRLVPLRFPRAVVVMAHRAGVQIAAIYGKGLRGRLARLRHTRAAESKWGGVRFDATW